MQPRSLEDTKNLWHKKAFFSCPRAFGVAFSELRGEIIRSPIIAAARGICLFSPRAQAQDRSPPIPADKLTDAQKKAIEEFKAARSAELSGPFIPLLRSPEVMSRARAMGDYVRFRSVLPPRLSEFVILITSRQWTQSYEWNAHEPLARQGGLNADVINAI